MMCDHEKLKKWTSSADKDISKVEQIVVNAIMVRSAILLLDIWTLLGFKI